MGLLCDVRLDRWQNNMVLYSKIARSIFVGFCSSARVRISPPSRCLHGHDFESLRETIKLEELAGFGTSFEVAAV